jgi:hypothetical protein
MYNSEWRILLKVLLKPHFFFYGNYLSNVPVFFDNSLIKKQQQQ